MASKILRNDFEQFLTDNYTTYPVIDLSALIDGDKLPKRDTFIGLEYTGATEERQSLNNCYRENGSILLHAVANSTNNPVTDKDFLIDTAKELRDLLRGKRINAIQINRVDPVEFNIGFPFQSTGRISATLTVAYQMDYKFSV